MKKEDLIKRIQEIGTCEDDSQRRTLLGTLQTECEKDYDQLTTLKDQNKELTEKNEQLRSANMQLFTMVGKPKDEGSSSGGSEEPETKELKYEDLFNEEGGLK